MLNLVQITDDHVLVIESDLGNERDGFKEAIEELRKSASSFALAEAAKNGLGCTTLGLTVPASYPVDEAGSVVEDPSPPPGKLFRYRMDIKVAPSL